MLRKRGALPPLPYTLLAWCLISHMGSLTFTPIHIIPCIFYRKITVLLEVTSCTVERYRRFGRFFVACLGYMIMYDKCDVSV